MPNPSRTRAVPSLASLLLVAAPLAGCERAPTVEGASRAEALRAAFPAHAAEVLEAPRPFVRDARGFAAQGGGWSSASGLEIALPAGAADAARIRSGAFEVRVRERGLRGEGALAERAVVYPRAGGGS